MAWVAVGSAAISAVGGMFAKKSASKAQKKADQAALEAQKQQRIWDVEDRDKARAYDLEDRAARQSLLNPYAAYFKGTKLAKPVVAVAMPEPEAPVAAPIGMQGSVGGVGNYNSHFRTQQR